MATAEQPSSCLGRSSDRLALQYDPFMRAAEGRCRQALFHWTEPNPIHRESRAFHYASPLRHPLPGYVTNLVPRALPGTCRGQRHRPRAPFLKLARANTHVLPRVLSDHEKAVSRNPK